MNNIVLFEEKQVRRIWDETDQQWFFAVVDVIASLTDSDKPRDYWYRMKRREHDSSGVELSTFCRQLKLESSDHKRYENEIRRCNKYTRIALCKEVPQIWKAVGLEEKGLYCNCTG